MKKVLKAFVGLAAIGSPFMASAVDVAGLATTAEGQLDSVADLISSGAYIIGAATGVMSLLKFKEHNENPQQSKISKPITLLAVSGGLLALPSFLTVGQDSLGLVDDTGGGENGLGGGLLR